MKTNRYISGKVLSQSEKDSSLERQSALPTYERYVFDGDLFDLIASLFPEQTVKEVHNSIKDHKCTKQFQDREAMMPTVGMFTGTSKRVNVHEKAEFRAATVLLTKYVLPAHTKIDRVAYDEHFDELIVNKRGAAGIPASGSKHKNREYMIELADRITRLIAEGVAFSDITIPAKCFHRAQISDYVSDDGLHYRPETLKKKDRLVMGLDGGTVLVEASHGKHIYDILKYHSSSYAGGKNPRDLRRDIADAWHGKFWASLDYSKFDMHLPADLIAHVFDILNGKYVKEENKTEWEWIKYNFIYTQFQTPDNRYCFKTHGIPSGSYFTQPVGTLCNLYMALSAMCHVARKRYNCTKTYQMIDWCLHHLRVSGKALGSIAMIGMGDDGIIFADIPFGDIINLMSQFVLDNFGVKVNSEKSSIGGPNDYPEFLKRQWREDGEYQNPIQMLVNLIHNERERSYDGYDPIHILYGMYHIYTSTFREAGITHEQLLLLVNQSRHGIGAFLNVEHHNYPGSYKIYGDETAQIWFKEAERGLSRLGVEINYGSYAA